MISENKERVIHEFNTGRINTNGVPAGDEEIQGRVDNWLEMLDYFESFTEDVKGEHHLYNLELIYDVRITIESGQ